MINKTRRIRTAMTAVFAVVTMSLCTGCTDEVAMELLWELAETGLVPPL